MQMVEHIKDSATTQVTQTHSFVNATMQDIYHVIMALKDEKNLSADQQTAFENLQEKYLHNHPIGGEFTFDVHHYGDWTVEKILQYKPAPRKAEEHFVVEM